MKGASTVAGTLKAEGFPLLMHAPDMCRLLGIHENTLLARIKRGAVPPFTRIGSGPRARYEWYRPTVERWLASRVAA